jgi:uncharacterized phage-associated protein
MSESTPCDARELANFLLDAAEELKTTLSVTSLLKIIYFAHGWYLAEFQRPLIGQPFEAWQHGPVVRVVYDSFKRESGGVIKSRAMKIDPKIGKYVVCSYSFEVGEQDFLKRILISYSRHHPYTLSEMTHDPFSPWTEVWSRSEFESAPGMRIDNVSIKNYFLKLNPADIYRS